MASDAARAAHQAQFPQQPEIHITTLAQAIVEFEMSLPGWWWSIGVCSRSRHASCAPDMSGPDADLIESDTVPVADRVFDPGFHCDHSGSVVDALLDVMNQGLTARAKARPSA